MNIYPQHNYAPESLHYLPTTLTFSYKFSIKFKVTKAKYIAKHKSEIQKLSFTIYNYVEAKLCSPCH